MDFQPVTSFDPRRDSIPPRPKSEFKIETEKIDSGEGTIGRELGWDNATMDHGKIQDVMLLAATGHKVEFIKMHHQIRDVMDADVLFSGKKIPGLGTIKTFSDIYGDRSTGVIYESLGKRETPLVSVVNEQGEETHRIDLRQLVQLLHIKEFNRRVLGRFKLRDEEIEAKFFAGEPIIATINNPQQVFPKGGGEVVDLRQKCPIDDLTTFDFKKYIGVIQQHQLGLQTMVERKEDPKGGWQQHHAQNSGQAVSAEVRWENPYSHTWEDVELFVPDCITRVKRNGRGDVGKKPVSFLAATNPHEIQDYDEKTGLGVFTHSDLIAIHRKTVNDYRAHDQGSPRIWKAALGQQKDEAAYVTFELVTYKKGQEDIRKPINVLHIGGENREGIIYSALHNTYDLAMQEGRGFELTDEEADDMVLTDIIAPWLANSTKDWNMCLAKAAGDKLDFTNLQALQQNGGSWADRTPPFCLKIRCLNLITNEIEAQPFYSLDALIDYVNQRIKRGDIPGVSPDTIISRYQGLSAEEIKQMEESVLPEDTTTEKEVGMESLKPEDLQRLAGIIKQLFGESSHDVMEKYVKEGSNVLITVPPANLPILLIDYVRQKLSKIDTSFDMSLREVTKEADRTKAVDILINQLGRFSEPVRREIFNRIAGSEIAQPGSKLN